MPPIMWKIIQISSFAMVFTFKFFFPKHLHYRICVICFKSGILNKEYKNTFYGRDRSFDRITFFRNSSVVLSKFVLKEKIRSFEYRPRLNVLSNDVLLNGLIRSIDLAWLG